MTFWRWLGLALQLAGYAAVATGIVDIRRRYSDRPGVVATVRHTVGRWWRRIRHRPQIVALSGSASLTAVGHVTMSQTFAAAEMAAPLDQRVAEVERQLRHLELRHNQLAGSFSDEVSKGVSMAK